MWELAQKGEYTMALPKAIQDQIDQVEQFEQSAVDGQAAGETSQTVDSVAAVNQETVVVADPAKAAAEPDHHRAEVSDADIQRLRTIEGKYSAEVPRLHADLRAQEAETGTLRRELEEMRRKLETVKQEPEKVVTTKDDDVFGADLVEMVRRTAGDEFRRLSSSFLTEVDKRLNPLREQMGQVSKDQAVSAEDRFWAKLNEAVPDWQTINGAESWQNWLAEFDPIAGTTRQAALDQAQSRMDSGRIAAMFNLFKSQDPAHVQAASAAGQTKSRQQELGRQVAPPKTKASVLAPQGEKIWSQSEFLNAMDPRKKAEIGYEAWVQLQEDADKAFQEGRVR